MSRLFACLLALGLWWLCGAAQADPNATYKVAQDHYLAQRYTEALPLFLQVVREIDSPIAQLYVGRCLRELSRRVEAHAAIARALAMAQARSEPRFAETARFAAEELAELEQKLGRVRVELVDAPPGTRVEVAGAPVVDLAQPVVVEPGEVRVDGIPPEGELRRETVRVAAGAIAEVTLRFAAVAPPPAPGAAPEPTPAATSGGGVRFAGYFVAGLGVAGLVTFGAAFGVAEGLHGDLEESCKPRCTQPAQQDDIDRGRTLDAVAAVGLAVGIGAGVGGALMIALGGPSSAEAAPVAVVGPGGAIFGYRGRF